MEKRLLTQRKKIINLLKDAGDDGVTNSELSKISLRYGGHINEMYRQGYKMKKFNLGGGLFRYKFISEPSQISIPTNAHHEFMNEVESRLGEDISAEVSEIFDDFFFHVVRRNGWYLREPEQMEMDLYQEH